MKLFIRSSILKSTSVEMSAPVTVESTFLDKPYKKTSVLQGVPVEYAIFQRPLELEPEIMPGQDMIHRAEQEAETILTEAKRKANALLEAARNESDEIRKTLMETIQEEIRSQAHAEGYESGLANASLEAERMCTEAKSYLELAHSALQHEYEKVNQDLVHLCLKICERILRSTIRVEPEKLLRMIHSLELMPREKQGMKMHISPQDYEWFKNLPAQDKPIYSVIPDDTLQPGDAFLECEEGIFDARLDSQLERVTQYLLEEMKHGLDGTRQEN